MNKTAIEWTDFSSNPLKYRDAKGKVVWGCVKTSPACAHCYAEAIAHHYQRGGPFTAKTMAGLTPFLDDKELHRMLTYKPAGGKRCFVGDMTDLAGEWVPFELLDRLFAVFAIRSDVTWQVLTKRAERLLEYITEADGRDFNVRLPGPSRSRTAFDWPLPNLWLGVSVENQEQADKRIPLLLRTPAAGRFLSCEPLLGPVQFPLPCRGSVFWSGINWVIVGGESGHDARPMHPEWVRSLRDQCQAAGVPFFFKQWGEFIGIDWSHSYPGEWRPSDDQAHFEIKERPSAESSSVRVGKKAAGRLLDGREWSQFPLPVIQEPTS